MLSLFITQITYFVKINYRIVILDHVKAGTIQASDNSKITYNDLTVSALSILANGILEEYEF